MNSNLFILEMQRLHALKLKVHWLKPKDKMPVEGNWSSIERRSVAYLEKSYQSGMNIGVVLGAASKLADGRYLAVIDCDVKSTDPQHQKEMEQELDRIFPSWRNSPIVKSGRGGGSKHIWCATTEPIKKFNAARSKTEIPVFMGHGKPSKRDEETLTPEQLKQGLRVRPAWEIDVLATGNQVAIPPSIHPLSGKPYEWLKIFGKNEDLITADFIKPEKQQQTKIKDVVTGKFEPVFYDFAFTVGVSKEMEDLIVDGRGLEKYEDDRSRALFAATLALVEAGCDDKMILTILSDPDNYLGEACYHHSKSKDRSRAVHWLNKYTLQKVREQKSADYLFRDEALIEDAILSPEDAAVQEVELSENNWRSQLDKTEQGKVRVTVNNLLLILKNTSKEKNFIFFDLFYSTNFFQSAPPWSQNTITEATEIKDIDITNGVAWFSIHWGMEVQPPKLILALDQLASENKRHPIREHLRTLKWDEKPRLDSWLKKYLGATEDDFYLKIVGRKMLIALVTRVFNPGCKFDQIVILQGGQGAGKSTALKILATKKWFTDKLGDISNKDALMTMHRHWLIEIGELDSMKKADVEEFKLFASTEVDVFRKPYGHLTESYPRQSIMVGTTNKDEFLVDETGNRRFWPVSVADELDLDSLQAERDQLIAEAVAAYDSGEQLWFENWKSADAKRFKKLAEAVQNKFTVSDDWENEVAEIFAKPDHGLNLNGFTLLQLWAKMQNFGVASISSLPTAVSLRLGKILRSQGFKKKNSNIVSKGKDQKVWFKVDDGNDYGF